MYSRTSDPDDDEAKYKFKPGVSRKKLRELQRKNAKRIKHEKKLEWLKRRKDARNQKHRHPEHPKPAADSSPKSEAPKAPKPAVKDGQSQQPKATKRVKFDPNTKDNSYEDKELEYLEKQLLKNRKAKGDALQELKTEFMKDGYDEDFLDFLSNITRIGDREQVLDNEDLYEEDAKLVKHRNDEAVDEGDAEDESEEEEEEDDGDPEEPEPEEPAEDDAPETLEDVKRKQTGLVNRLSEGNFTVILNQLSDMYSNLIAKVGALHQQAKDGEGTQAFNEAVGELCDAIVKMIAPEANVVLSLLATQAALVCALSNHFGTTVRDAAPQVLCTFLAKLLKTFEASLKLVSARATAKRPPEDRDAKLALRWAPPQLRNVIIAVCALLFFELVDSGVVFHLAKLLTGRELNEDVLQLLLVLLKYSSTRPSPRRAQPRGQRRRARRDGQAPGRARRGLPRQARAER